MFGTNAFQGFRIPAKYAKDVADEAASSIVTREEEELDPTQYDFHENEIDIECPVRGVFSHLSFMVSCKSKVDLGISGVSRLLRIVHFGSPECGSRALVRNAD